MLSDAFECHALRVSESDAPERKFGPRLILETDQYLPFDRSLVHLDCYRDDAEAIGWKLRRNGQVPGVATASSSSIRNACFPQAI